MNNISLIRISDTQVPKFEDVMNSALKIQQELLIKDELLKKGITKPEHGLLLSRYSKDDVVDLLNRGGAVYLASYDGEPAGYMFTSSPEFFRKKCKGARLEWLDAQMKDAFEKIVSSGDFVFLGQIGISLKYHGKGVAGAIIKEVESDAKGRPLLGYIALSPINNVRSRAFFTKRGYVSVAKMTFPEYAGIKDFVADLVIKI